MARKPRRKLPHREDTAPDEPISSEDTEFLAEIKEEFKLTADAEDDNRRAYEDDVDFAMVGNQWPEHIKHQRERDFRPCLTINRMRPFIRQVVNDARQNRPGMHAAPVDSVADPDTAEVIEGLIRHIEYDSSADMAYDTAAECSVSGGFGYMRVDLEYAFYDSFDMDIKIKRIPNPLSVYGDRNSTEGDSNDWDYGFVTEKYDKTQWDREFGKKAKVSWESDEWKNDDWRDSEGAIIAEYWRREYVDKEIVLVDDLINKRKLTLLRETINERPEFLMAFQQGHFAVLQERVAKVPEVTKYILSGAEILQTIPWPGKYIPIIPVYGDEYWVDGKRVLRSLIHSAKDAQRNYNYWRTAGTELVALAPKAPFVGKQGTFDADPEKWNTINSEAHPFVEYETERPTREALDSGPAAGAISEAMNASDDIKATIGMYDASLGARSNEVSGKAIMARQREGDVATFHFQDNQNRAIRHLGRIIADLIPHVYQGPRVVRVLGEDEKERTVKVNQPTEKVDNDGNATQALHDLTTGKYDVRMMAGPSYTTRRQEAAEQMTEMARHIPELFMVAGDIMARNMDWPGAKEIAKRLEERLKKEKDKLPPEVMNMIQQGQETIKKLTEENKILKEKMNIEQGHLQVDRHEAQTKRMKVTSDIVAQQLPPIPKFGE